MRGFRGAVFASLLLAYSGVLPVAGQQSGPRETGPVAAGFSQGEKTGWQEEYPPGWDRKSEKQQKRWKDDIQKKRDGIQKAARKKGLTEADAVSAADSFEKAARKGLKSKEAEALVKNGIKKGKKGAELASAIEEESAQRMEKKAARGKQAREKGGKKK